MALETNGIGRYVIGIVVGLLSQLLASLPTRLTLFFL